MSYFLYIDLIISLFDPRLVDPVYTMIVRISRVCSYSYIDCKENFLAA